MDEIMILGIGSLASFCIYSRFLLFPLQHLVPPKLWISKIEHHFSPFAFVCQITCAVSHLDNLLLSPEVKVSSLFLYAHLSTIDFTCKSTCLCVSVNLSEIEDEDHTCQAYQISQFFSDLKIWT